MSMIQMLCLNRQCAMKIDSERVQDVDILNLIKVGGERSQWQQFWSTLLVDKLTTI